jgi:hypothetical protein
MRGLKHLIQCHCILPQFKNRKEPIFHKFVVFSECNDNDEIVQKFSRCNNCGVIHKIVDFCKSEMFYGAEDAIAIVSEDDIRHNIPENVVMILENHKCDLATWEQTCFNFENKLWGVPVIIAKEKILDSTQIKKLVLSESGVKIDSYLRKDEIDGKSQ